MNTELNINLYQRAEVAFALSTATYAPTALGQPDPETLRRVEYAIMSMHSTTREIFLAHRLDNESYANIASKTGLSVRHVEFQMAMAIRQLGLCFYNDERAKLSNLRQSLVGK